MSFTIFENKLLFFTFWYIFRRENIYSRAQLILRWSKGRFIFNFQFETIWYSEEEPLFEDSIAFFNKYNRVSHKLKLVKFIQQKLSRKATMELPKTRKRHNNWSPHLALILFEKKTFILVSGFCLLRGWGFGWIRSKRKICDKNLF